MDTPYRGYGMTLAPTLGLGIDAGGTSTRWALADGMGNILCEGSVSGLTALMMGNEAGRTQVREIIGALVADVTVRGLGAPARVVAGFTGYSDDQAVAARLQSLIGAMFDLPAPAVAIISDVEAA